MHSQTADLPISILKCGAICMSEQTTPLGKGRKENEKIFIYNLSHVTLQFFAISQQINFFVAVSRDAEGLKPPKVSETRNALFFCYILIKSTLVVFLFIRCMCLRQTIQYAIRSTIISCLSHLQLTSSIIFWFPRRLGRIRYLP